MGNSFSSPTKDETRRVNRLSKPLTKKSSTLNAPQLPPIETDGPELASGLIGWQNPWVGSNISKDVKTNPSRKRESLPTLTESKSESSLKWNVTRHSIDVSHPQPSKAQDVEPLSPLSPRSGTLSASPSVRRASCQTESLATSSKQSLDLGRPKRANSIQTPLQRHRSAIYGDKAHEATSSNTHFTVGNQRFSLTRRRSLLTRPGLATRRSTAAVTRRFPSPIGEPECSTEDSLDSNTLQWPLPPLQRTSLPVSSSMRPTSPTDPRYTQLGALKLGSLRVVNGSASPCPSERIPLGQTQVVGTGAALPDRLETMRSKGTPLQIPAVPDLQKSDDVPGSPFSFEKSPTITVQPRHKTIFPIEAEDEGIGMCDEGSGLNQTEKNTATINRSTSRSLNKTDSGYSSATSVHSIYRSRTRASFDSQTSGSCTADSTKGIGITSDGGANDQTCDLRNEKIQRHTSLQEVKPGNFSQLYPNSTRWYDSSAPSSQSSGSRVRRSTLCAPRNTEYPYPVQTGPGPGPAPAPGPYASYQSFISSSSSSFASQDEPTLSTRGPLYGDTFSTSTLNVLHDHDSSSTATLETLNSCQQQQSGSLTKTTSARSRSRSKSLHGKGSRAWRHDSIIEIPKLPTILSPDHLQSENTEEEMELEFPIPTSTSTPETYRGRPRSRSQDYRRRKLTKTRPQPDVHITTSPYAL
ncbi:hypothetical protein N7509_002174 [Penicillium cosmopolitanum]|uniref:Uncharacterized protein n=1 Tax=Penicillium cosmopolitanum TaxID=1131564 RepID=A0A9W9W8C4_9EURO|nr:uncharacterized protein N7509_002174 [Penicillium cosmopolitanum]KAJ5408291.1 hypothetical protein N7509_002174 [Penicillium cosmopolitanum]